MRVAIITESFPPDVNGVAHCVLRVAELLTSGGHHPLVIAPQPPRAKRDEKTSYPFPVVRVPAVPLPGYPGFRLGLPGRRVRSALIGHRTEVVHLASPVVLGAHGAAVARRLGLPTVAVYQTDLPSYARAYRLGRAGEAFAWRWLRGIHNGAARTLAPSTVTATGLLGQGIENVWLWGRGVDTRRFHPAKRSPRIRARLAPDGELIAGYVGRLATEKRVDLLAGITALDGVRLVIVGAGPAEAALRQQLPGAVFLGERRGEELAAIYASLDVFVHSGPYETFGQTLQEAAASGLPVVAPAAGGPLDLVKDGATGYLVPPSDPGAFTAAVARLAADPATRAAFGAAGRRKVLGRTWPALTEELTGHYAAVLRSAGGSAAGQGRRETRQGHDMRIVRLANFVAPHSGGLRTSLAELGAGYLAAGHEPVLVIPGERDGDELTAQGRVITLRAPRVPFTGGYRVLWRRRRLARLLADLRPDALEVSDRTTLRWTGAWAREHGVPAVMVSHESVTALLKLTRCWGWTVPLPTGSTGAPPGPTIGSSAPPAGRRPSSGGSTRATWSASRSAWTWTRSAPASGQVRTRYVGEGQILLVHCGRLSAEKKPQRSLTTLATLRAAGMPVRLVVAGDGPLRARLVRRARAPACRSPSPASCPAAPNWPRCWPAPTWLSRPGRRRPSGWPPWRRWPRTPVVVSAESALPEVIGDAGAGSGRGHIAAGVRAVLARSEQPAGPPPAPAPEQYHWRRPRAASSPLTEPWTAPR